MTEVIFSGASLLAVGAWLCLGFALLIPRGATETRLRLFAGRQVPIVLCAVYVVVLCAHWRAAPQGNFASLPGVIELFALPEKMLGGWLHFLALDLLIGRAVIDHGQASGIPRILLLALLPLIFFYAPAGVIAYLLTGYLWQHAKRWTAGWTG